MYADPASPVWLKDRLGALDGAGVLHVRFRAEAPPPVLLRDIEQAVGGRSATLITTNLDNDDALAVDFLARVQAVRPPAGRAAIFLTDGLVLAHDRVYLHRDAHNAFASVREPWDPGAHTCWSQWHNLLHRSMPTAIVPGPPAWLQVVHERNVSNRARGRLIDVAPSRARFTGLVDHVPAPSPRELARDRLLERPARVARDRARGFARDTAIQLFGRDGFDRLKSRVLGSTG